MTTGITAAITISATGLTASPFAGEIDLAINAAGDLLAIDRAGDALIATSAITFTGTTASLVAPDPSNTLETEPWTGLATEQGQTLATEGS